MGIPTGARRVTVELSTLGVVVLVDLADLGDGVDTATPTSAS
jgi:hypothetical protein